MLKLPFEFKSCTQECGKICGTEVEHCSTYQKLPPPIQEVCKKSPHLLNYLHAFPIDKLGMPEYFAKVGRSLKGKKNPNLIYPAGSDVFIHILSNPEDVRDHYVPIEPSLADGQEDFLDQIEARLADYVEDLEGITEAAKRLEVVMQIVDKVVNVRAVLPPKAGAGKKSGRFGMLTATKEKLVITPVQYASLRYLLRRKLEGLGLLQPLIDDPNIEDISCSGLGNIFVEHKLFGGLRTSICFEEHTELDKFVIQLAEGIRHPVTFREPCVDATLPDGSRINIVYGTDVSKRGSNFTIRKFSDTPISVLELVGFNSMNYEMAAYLSIILQEGMNVWVSGETASGKTTLLNALTTFIAPEAKIVSIEDTPEVQVPHHNWIRGVTRGSAKNSESSEVSMFDLLKAALRQRPNLIIVGEIRGAEGAIAFQAMQTGHACMSTFHAASVAKLIQRVTGNPINVPKTYVDNLNVIIIAQQVRLPSGSLARRVTSINEIVSYDSVSDSFSFIEVFNWDPLTDTFNFRGFQNSYLLEYKIAPRRGLPHEKRREVYKVLKQRADILKRIADQKKTNFYEVYAILSKAKRDGLFR
ncbi:MAG: type II/IV secretion system ATPase subunit [Dehalococcoidales bacterium]|nr:type II/IV secretion system ATPase subunit [Dehalococcoidales bacterium]